MGAMPTPTVGMDEDKQKRGDVSRPITLKGFKRRNRTMPNRVKLCVLAILILSLSAFAKYDPNNFTPDNAAYWYQKAFDLYEEPNGFDLSDYTTGDVKITPQVEQYLIRQQPVIDLLKKAAQIEHCDWQFDPLADGIYSVNPYLSKAKKTTLLLLADGKYKERKDPDIGINTLFEPVLQLASHIDSGVLIDHLVALGLRSMTYDDIREYLNRHTNCQVTDLYMAKTFIRNESKRQKISYKDTIDHEIAYTTRILTHPKEYIYKDTYWTDTWEFLFKN